MYIFVAFFNSLVDENRLRVYHLIKIGILPANFDILDEYEYIYKYKWTNIDKYLAENDSFICEVDIGPHEIVGEERTALDEEYFGEPVDILPDFRRLFGSDNDNILELFEILGSEREEEVVDAGMDAADHDMVDDLVAVLETDRRHAHQRHRLVQQNVVGLQKLVVVVVVACLLLLFALLLALLFLVLLLMEFVLRRVAVLSIVINIVYLYKYSILFYLI